MKGKKMECIIDCQDGWDVRETYLRYALHGLEVTWRCGTCDTRRSGEACVRLVEDSLIETLAGILALVILCEVLVGLNSQYPFPSGTTVESESPMKTPSTSSCSLWLKGT